MLLTLTTTHRPATDIGFLLHKNPERVQHVAFGFGTAHLFYPEATAERATVAVVVDIDPIALVRDRKSGPMGNGFALGQYVNDRPYAASSFLSVVVGKVFSTAMAGNSKERPELVDTPMPLCVELPALPCRGGEPLLRQLFEPLGYVITTTTLALDEDHPEWGDSRYMQAKFEATLTVKELLQHFYVLMPVLDDDKHYWVGEDEIEKLLRRGGDWLQTHPQKELIAHRYLRHSRKLTDEALERLLEEAVTPIDAVEQRHDAEEEAVEARINLNDQRLNAVVHTLEATGAKRVLDLGCGEGRLLRELLKHGQFEKIVGMDVSHRLLETAARRMHFDDMAPRQRERIQLIHGSLTYRDRRLEHFDAAAVVEVIEHLDPQRLAALERSLFTYAQPGVVIVTTPNAEYNVRFTGLPAGTMRHKDHRFEWTRTEFRAWAERVAALNGYAVTFEGIGDDDVEVGSPTQMAVFRR